MQDLPRTLVHSSDAEPGISRRRCGTGFCYRAPDGTTIARGAERRRIEALAVPPAYQDVWICARPNGHLQATGRDARTRKQYRYHEKWTAHRAALKYGDLAAFGAALPAIRRRIARDLRGEAGEHAFALAAVLRMIDRLAMRIGTPDYAEENGTYGATTLRRKHLRLGDEELRLNYTAKGGRKVTRRLRDAGLARVLGKLHDLPGAALFSWIDDEGRPREVTSGEVNTLLGEVSGEGGFTAKTFRTWAGSEAALELALREETLGINAMAEAAAERLSNTPAVARGSYIHPKVIDLAGTPLGERAQLQEGLPEQSGLRKTERALLRLLQA